ncbi:MAG: Na+/H+ antiporter subunit E [Lachnospiraceae bacterium]|jgi:multicomponent Na+:H+ antiporter subunit E|nr:Na+/H+ antiporter subunit E [Lachnospiraceae bacterium]
MFVIYLVLWIVLNGNITLEIIAFGLPIAGMIYYFTCKFMDFSFKKDKKLMKGFIFLIGYGMILVLEILKANFATIKLITTSKYEIEPVIIKFRTKLKTKEARVILANSITLTPGTITVNLEEDEYTVHCLDKDLANGIEDSVFVKLLEKIEE